MASSEATDRLRSAILSMASEAEGLSGTLTEEEREVVEAWNAFAASSPTVGIPAPITETDIEGMFD